MFPLDTYWIVMFENGERWEDGCLNMNYEIALEQAASRHTKIKCFLYGYENSLGEFVPEKAFDSNGDPDNGLLLVNMIEAGLNSKNYLVAGMTAYATKKIMQEVKRDQAS
jgi:hypothetical protein